MHCVAGLDTLTSDAAFVGDTDLSTLDDRRLTLLRRDRVGFVFQAFNLLPTLTVVANITLPLDLRREDPLTGPGSTGSSTPSACGTACTTGRANSPAVSSWGSPTPAGRRRSVAVARAFVGDPDVVFADEPAGNLDSRSGEEVLRLLGRTVRETGRTVVMVTHDPVAAAHADEVVLLADGRLVDRMAAPTADRVLDRMKAFQTDTSRPSATIRGADTGRPSVAGVAAAWRPARRAGRLEILRAIAAE
ncbi:ABC transporter ATP-binding protein [Streptomyces sp. NPDC058659]|uniref:ABC transporter ATP-binding protein n=1 Tax=unclassified Streptomyces TaxID=2593676 RepID=UPI00365F8A6C